MKILFGMSRGSSVLTLILLVVAGCEIGTVSSDTRGPASVNDWNHSAAESAELSARIALLALRASLPEGRREVPRSFAFLPLTQDVSVEDAARKLKLLPKPLRCEASVIGDSVSVRCTSVTQPQEVQFSLDGAQRDIVSFGEAVMKVAPAPIADPLVVLRGSSESLVVPWSSVARWFRDYSVPHSIRFDPADSEARAQGACAVLSFFPIGIIHWSQEIR